jgi:hypothetical protein
VLVRKHAVEEPIPVLREIGSRRVGKAYSIGLLNAGNDFPPEVMGSLHRLSYGTGGGKLAFNKKGLRNNRPFLLVQVSGKVPFGYIGLSCRRNAATWGVLS